MSNHFEISKIVNVKEDNDYYEITFSHCTCVCLKKKYNITPKVGDTIAIRTWKGPFGKIMGIQINDQVAFEKSDEDMEREHQEWLNKYHKSQWEEYYKVLETIKDEEPFKTINLSGMSGSYEVACQKMLQAGIKFLKENPDFHFDYQMYKGIYGVCTTNTPWGKDLDKLLQEASNNNCTGAMHQCVIGHLNLIHKHGIEKWLSMHPPERQYTFPTELPKPDCPNPEL